MRPIMPRSIPAASSLGRGRGDAWFRCAERLAHIAKDFAFLRIAACARAGKREASVDLHIEPTAVGWIQDELLDAVLVLGQNVLGNSHGKWHIEAFGAIFNANGREVGMGHTAEV